MTTKAELLALSDTIEQLQADKRELMEALAPFAEWAGWFDSCDQHPHGCPDQADAGESFEITVGQVRAARSTLSKITSQHAK